ncbi:MAG: hypothetical protein LBK41_03530 [Clostridiales bacterium]|nr:hypothetical protein [Clostridiales bacterium]
MGIVDLLKSLADGMYDGERTDSEMNGVSSGFYIDKGTPVKYREGKSTKFFDGKENTRTPGKRTVERFETVEEKTTFLQKYGFIQDMFGNHPEVVDYSKQYYEDKKKKKQG